MSLEFLLACHCNNRFEIVGIRLGNQLVINFCRPVLFMRLSLLRSEKLLLCFLAVDYNLISQVWPICED